MALMYRLFVAAVAIGAAALWLAEPRFGLVEAVALLTGVALLALPLVGPPLLRAWSAFVRVRGGLPRDASDTDIIEFVGEELSRAGVAVEWRRHPLHPERLDSFQTVADPVVIVGIGCGVLTVNGPQGIERFVDPIAAVETILAMPSLRPAVAAPSPVVP